jgi:UDP-3-O-[3-hydroxymyristoyl] glucosamine N-acyltransferase
MSLSLGEIAVRYGCELRGDPDQQVLSVATLSSAGADQLAFLANPAYHRQLAETKAAAVLLAPADAHDCTVAALICSNPYLVYAQVAAELHPGSALQPGVHQSAVIAADCRIPDSCEIAAGTVIGSRVQLGERVRVGANAVLERDVVLADDSQVLAGVVVHAGVKIGARCILHAGCVIGSDGFGNARDSAGAWTKVPQLGSVVIGDDVEVGSNTTIDRGAIGDTRIGNGVRLDNLVQIGHNVEIGEHTAMASMSGSAGSTRIGARCMIGGRVVFAGHIEICDDVVILGSTDVAKSIRKPGVYGGPATTADEVSSWRRNAVRYRQLDSIARRLRALERAQGEPHAAD